MGESVLPVFLDSEAPLPGKMIVLVIVGELRLDVVGAAGQHSLGRFLQGGEEFVLLVWPRTVAANHVVRLVDCTLQENRGKEMVTGNLLKTKHFYIPGSA